jgi:hypothetical protein
MTVRTGYPYIVSSVGISQKLWRYHSDGLITWELRYVLLQLDIARSSHAWLRRNVNTLLDLMATFRLREDYVLRSRTSSQSKLHERFNTDRDNTELQFSTVWILAYYARIASDATHFSPLQRGKCEASLRYFFDVISSNEVELRIPVLVGGEWIAVVVKVRHGRVIGLHRYSEHLIGLDQLASDELYDIFIHMARPQHAVFVDQAPSVAHQLAQLLDTYLGHLMQSAPTCDLQLLPVIRGPSGSKIRRMCSATQLFLAGCKHGGTRQIRIDTNSALDMSSKSAWRVDCRAIDAYTVCMRNNFKTARRIHMAVDGACYTRRERMLGPVYRPDTKVAGLLHPMAPPPHVWKAFRVRAFVHM